jgi:hypothetical protein
MSNARQKTAIEIQHAQETLKGSQICGRRKGKDRLDFGGQRIEARRCNPVS